MVGGWASGCNGSPDGASGDGSASARADDPRPNILLISLDTLRADRLGSYGNQSPTSPFLDELAERGLRFENAFVNTHGTPPSHATLFTSLYQEFHKVSMRRDADGKLDHRLPADLPSLPEHLREAGYETVAVVGGGFMSEDFDFDRGFDRFIEKSGVRSQVDRFVAEVSRASKSGKPIFAFFHTYEIHSPYRPPESYALRFVRKPTKIPTASDALLEMRRAGRIPEGDDLRYLSDLYDAGIRNTDDQMRRLFRLLGDADFFDNHVAVVTSDHGEEFGEHGSILHPATLYEELVRIPLLISGNRLPQARVPARFVSTIDIAPTLYRLSSVEPPAGMQGRDLLEASSQGADLGVYMQYRDLLAAVRDGRHKLIFNRMSGKARLFDLENDPGERRDIAKHNRQLAQRLQSRISAWLKRAANPLLEEPPPSTHELDEERLEQMRSLGYVG